MVCRLDPADVSLLKDIFGVGPRTEHSVGNSEKPRPMCVK